MRSWRSVAQRVAFQCPVAAAARARASLMQRVSTRAVATSTPLRFRFPTAPTIFGYRGLLSDFDTTSPHMSVRESDAAALIELEVPRFRTEDIAVTPAEDGTISIVGRRRADHHEPSFEHLLFGYSQPTAFRRAVHFSPRFYDVTKATTELSHGVLTVTVPKVPRSEPVKLMEAPPSSELALRTTPAEFEAIAKAKWPPTIKREETAAAVKYRCELPPTVTKDHVELTLDGRRLLLAVHYALETKTRHGTQSQSVTYTTALGVPDGVVAADIHSQYDGGTLTVEIARKATPAAIPVQPTPAQ